ncbi:hypothetical protein [Companilactobacillus jidongensis]|uniref:hypothetical protein n=1 Tax=Companilactobacillus jidongensis TaxID=2486006 RepID=UPI000F76DD3A|nr:hypothetical protein [Companilactobacillus jidongensis]
MKLQGVILSTILLSIGTSFIGTNTIINASTVNDNSIQQEKILGNKTIDTTDHKLSSDILSNVTETTISDLNSKNVSSQNVNGMVIVDHHVTAAEINALESIPQARNAKVVIRVIAKPFAQVYSYNRYHNLLPIQKGLANESSWVAYRGDSGNYYVVATNEYVKAIDVHVDRYL